MRATCHSRGVFHLFGQFVAGFNVVQTWVVVLEAFESVVGGFQRFVGNHQHIDALFEFNFGNLGSLFIQQERGYIHRDLAQYRGGVVLLGLFLDDAQNLQRRAFRVADMTRTATAWAGNGRAFRQRGLQALATHFHQAELADGAELHTSTVLAQRIAQAVFHFAAVFGLLHVDEVDHDQATQVAQAHLARDFVGSFQVGAGGGFFDVAAFDGAGRVHVHGDQRLGVVDHDGTTGGQLHGAGIGRFDLVLDLEAAEQRGIVSVAFDAGGVFRHDVRHELLGLLVNVVGVDQDVTDVIVEVVTDCADHQARFLVNQESTLGTLSGTVDGAPELEQVVQIPLQLRRAAANAGGARDDGHAFGVFQLVHRVFEIGTVVAFNATAHATTTRVVGHQHHITAGQRHKGRQCRALVAALFFFHLDQQLLAFAYGVLDAGVACGYALLEVLFRDFFERQEAVTVFTVIDKTSFERWLNTRDNGLVNIAFALLAAFNLNFIVEQFLPVNNGQAAFFSLGGVNQHPFHG